MPLLAARLILILTAVIMSQSVVWAQVESWRQAYDAAGRHYEAGELPTALRHAQLARELVERAAPGHIDDVAQTLNLEAVILDRLGRLREAEPLYRTALQQRQQHLRPDDPRIAESLNNLAALSSRLGRHTEAETLHKRALAIREQTLGANHPDVAQSLNNLASAELALGRPEKAGPLLRRAVAILAGESAGSPLRSQGRGQLADFGQSDPDADDGVEHVGKAGATIRASLSPTLRPPGRTSPGAIEPGLLSSENDGRGSPLGASAPPIDTSSVAPGSLAPVDHAAADRTPAREAELAVTLLNLGMMAQTAFTGPRRDEAGQLYRRAIEIQQQALGADHPDLAESLNNLAEFTGIQREYDEAEELHKRALAIREKALGQNDPKVAVSLTNLARLYSVTRRPKDAIPLLQRALAIGEQAVGATHPDVALTLRSLALAHTAAGDPDQALTLHRKATRSVLEHALAFDPTGVGNDPGATQNQGHLNYHFQSHIAALYQAVGEGTEPLASAQSEAFELVQHIGHSAAARALSQMAARFGQGTGELAAMVRTQQDLVATWHALDGKLLSALGAIANERDDVLIRSVRAGLAAAEQRLASLTTTISREFADYSDLASPARVSISALQQMLRSDEVLVQFHFGSYGSYAWLVSKEAARWTRLAVGRGAIASKVATLRCGLDSAAWYGSGEYTCQQLLKTDYGADDLRKGKPLPFDLAIAYELYGALFAPLEDLTKPKRHLLVVPAAALTKLPLQVLVTEKPTVAIPANPADYANAAWLARHHAVTVVPSVASLKALRQHNRVSQAERGYVAFANPLLMGRPSPDNDHARRAREAQEKQSCSAVLPPEAAVPPVSITGALPKASAGLFRGGLGDVAALRAVVPLPETADEVCAVGKARGALASDVLLGARATEAAIKKLSAKGALATYKVLHLATHGLVAGETERVAHSLAEPALLLTPPETATDADDGLLTASEVAQLRLDADWVVLSACNTAAADQKGNAEALSGLARAFFYAGARALLVSHWYVDSRAAVKLTTGAFAVMTAEPSIGPAEALRRATLATMADADRPKHWTPAAHPAVWAPFAVVGEGAGVK
jgi:CHAT domain-containing protein/tetratricopeptide (TPR) repeat protein